MRLLIRLAVCLSVIGRVPQLTPGTTSATKSSPKSLGVSSIQLPANQIVDILRRHPSFDTDFVKQDGRPRPKCDKSTQDHWIFLHAATWPDQIRKNKQYDRPTWHYIDIPQFFNDSDRQGVCSVGCRSIFRPSIRLGRRSINGMCCKRSRTLVPP